MGDRDRGKITTHSGLCPNTSGKPFNIVVGKVLRSLPYQGLGDLMEKAKDCYRAGLEFSVHSSSLKLIKINLEKELVFPS